MQGGKRENAGRKSTGITRKVSLTFSEEEWAEFENSGMIMADYIRHLKKVTQVKDREIDELKKGTSFKEGQDTSLNKVTEIKKDEYPLRIMEERIDRYFKDHPDLIDLKEAVRTKMVNDYYRDGVFYAETKPQYIGLYDGKRYGSPDKLIVQAIPFLVNSLQARAKYKEASERREQARKDRLFIED